MSSCDAAGGAPHDHRQRHRSRSAVLLALDVSASHRISNCILSSSFMSPAKRSRSSSYATSDESDHAPRKRARSSSASDSSDEHRRLKVYIVHAKLSSDEVARLYNLVETHSVDGGLDFELTPNPNVADVIVTAVRMRKRLERHVDWELAVSHLS